MAFTPTNIDFHDYLLSRKINVSSDPVRLIGIRGAALYDGGPQISCGGDDRLDLWNDLIGYWGAELSLFTATVKPGAKYTYHPLNKLGAAHLMTLEEGGKPWIFRWGMHHGKYRCLVQGTPFTVRRDTNRDGKIEAGEPEMTGEFAIHLHHAGPTDSAHVGPWSAGCQVLAHLRDWATFFKVLTESKQTKFVYYLIEGQAFLDWMKKAKRV